MTKKELTEDELKLPLTPTDEIAEMVELPTETPEVPEKLDMAEFTKMIKQQVIDEMKNDQTRAMEEASQRREAEASERKAYFDKMKESPDPWVEIIGWVETEQGVRVEMEWNNAFIDFLSTSGIKGTDEDQVVQRWVAMLLHNMAADMDDSLSDEDQSEFS